MVVRELSKAQLESLDLAKVKELVNIVSRCRSNVFVTGKDKRIHLGSIIGAFTLSTYSNEPLKVEITGPDEEQTLKKLMQAWDKPPV